MRWGNGAPARADGKVARGHLRRLPLVAVAVALAAAGVPGSAGAAQTTYTAVWQRSDFGESCSRTQVTVAGQTQDSNVPGGVQNGEPPTPPSSGPNCSTGLTPSSASGAFGASASTTPSATLSPPALSITAAAQGATNLLVPETATTGGNAYLRGDFGYSPAIGGIVARSVTVTVTYTGTMPSSGGFGVAWAGFHTFCSGSTTIDRTETGTSTPSASGTYELSLTLSCPANATFTFGLAPFAQVWAGLEKISGPQQTTASAITALSATLTATT